MGGWEKLEYKGEEGKREVGDTAVGGGEVEVMKWELREEEGEEEW